MKRDLDQLLVQLRPDSTDYETLTSEIKFLKKNQNEHWYALGSRLLKILKEQLYRSGGHATFSSYCRKELGYHQQYVQRLINVVLFIDEQWQQAFNDKQRAKITRLFQLGFPKLFLLHTLSPDIIDQLLNKGITTNEQAADMIEPQPLEIFTVNQLLDAIKLSLPGWTPAMGSDDLDKRVNENLLQTELWLLIDTEQED